VNKQKILYRGAEAIIVVSKYGKKETVQKKRLPKKYRIPEIDQHLIKMRTKEEAKLISIARTSGVAVPIIYDIDLYEGILTMEYIRGKRIKDILNKISEAERKKLCNTIGQSIARLHNHDIAHGDITTSNMILFNDRVYFIDFGLGCITREVEIKGVDLHVLMEAFESTHSQYPTCFRHVLNGYEQEYEGNANEVLKKIDEIVQRGRYR
jgi:Kae1-associated kinase Bud32